MIREMQQEDIKRVEEIWYQESVRVHNWMDDPKKFWDKRRKNFTDETNAANVKFVYKEEDIIVGFITMKGNYILETFVDHKYRKDSNGRSKRIGTSLLNHLKCYPSLIVSVYMLNHKAIKFYIKNNFIITKLYTEEGQDLVSFG